MVFEFIVIVIGVLTAFGLQTISESFSDNIKKKKYLMAIRQELATNIALIDQKLQRRTNQFDSTKVLIQILSGKQKDEEMIIDYMENFYILNEMTWKLGSYEAFKTSQIFDQVESIDLLTKLNNLDAKIVLTLDWQKRIQDISFDLFVTGNDGAINLANYKPEFEKVFLPGYIEKIVYLGQMRLGLTEEFILLSNEMREVQNLIDLEMK